MTRPTKPLIKTALLLLLAFALSAASLLVYLSVTQPKAPTADRYVNAQWQARLARGLAWLQPTLVIADGLSAKSVSVCQGSQALDLLACRRHQINQRLALAQPARQLQSDSPPPDALLPDVLATMQWLLRYGGPPERLSTLLQQGPDAARQSLRDPFRLSGDVSLACADTICEPTLLASDRNLPLQSADLLNPVWQYASANRGQSPNQTMAPNAVGHETRLVQGRHVQLTLDNAVQQLAQTTAACFAGDAWACQTCDWCNTVPAQAMYEQARARALGILVLDAKTGAIEAAASASTPCYVRQHRGLAAGPDCPVLPHTLAPHPDRLGNLALEGTARLASLSKIVIALGLQQAGLSPAEASSLPAILTRSLTPELIDIVMCKSQNFEPSCAIRRLAAVAQLAEHLHAGGRVEVLGAGQLPGMSRLRFTARLLQHSDRTSLVLPTLRLKREALADCSRLQWRRCQGAELVNIVAELFGTGDALASPVGIGQVLLHLAAVANGQKSVAQAHLVARAQDNSGAWRAVAPALRLEFSASHGAPVLAGLSQTTTQGTARQACLAAATAWPGGQLPCATTASLSTMRIAGKTGTPVFSADQGSHISRTLPQWRSHCQTLRQELALLAPGNPRRFAVANNMGKCDMPPSKWFAFLVSAPGSTTWDKVIVVMAERNWNQHTDLIDTPNDFGSSVAAEAGLSLANRLYSQIRTTKGAAPHEDH